MMIPLAFSIGLVLGLLLGAPLWTFLTLREHERRLNERVRARYQDTGPHRKAR